MRPSLVIAAALVACASRPAPSTPPTCPQPAPVAAPDAAVTAPPPVAAPVQCVAPTPPAVTAEEGGCPPSSVVWVVHRWEAEPADDACGRPQWVLSHGVDDDHVFVPDAEGAEADGSVPRYHALTADEARAAQVMPIAQPVWVFSTPDAPPCQATAGRAWATMRSADGPRYQELAHALHGCTFPDNATGPFYAVISAERPSRCRYRPMPAAVTRGAAHVATVRARTPTRACVAPGCRFSWSRATVQAPDGVLDEVQAQYVFSQRDTPDCGWPRDWYHSVTWSPRRGGPWVRLLANGPVVGILYDNEGAATVITEASGEVETFGPRGPNAGMLHPFIHRRWYIANEEDTNSWTIQPSCL